jgi:hypothetical protein
MSSPQAARLSRLLSPSSSIFVARRFLGLFNVNRHPAVTRKIPHNGIANLRLEIQKTPITPTLFDRYKNNGRLRLGMASGKALLEQQHQHQLREQQLRHAQQLMALQQSLDGPSECPDCPELRQQLEVRGASQDRAPHTGR